MKALKLALAISLALNLALCWKLWWKPAPAQPLTEPTVSMVDADGPPTLNLPETEDLRPLPPDPLRVPLLVPGSERAALGLPDSGDQKSGSQPVTPVQFSPRTPAVGRPYAEPLPSNPYAVPLWERRVPFRESQFERGLYPKMRTDIPPARD